MTRDEAIQLLNCSLSELASQLGITTAAVAKWDKDKIPPLREYQIKELAAESNKLPSSGDSNLTPVVNKKNECIQGI